MAGSLAAIKKELRKKIKIVLKDVSDASAASQSSLFNHKYLHPGLMLLSVKCDQNTLVVARVQGCEKDQRLSIHAKW